MSTKNWPRGPAADAAKNDRKGLEQGCVTINTINTEKFVMGDELHGSEGSTIVNRSKSTHSFNRTRDDDGTKGAVISIGKGLLTWVWTFIKNWLGWS